MVTWQLICPNSNERSSRTARAICRFNPGFDSKYDRLFVLKMHTLVAFLLNNLLHRHSVMHHFVPILYNENVGNVYIVLSGGK